MISMKKFQIATRTLVMPPTMAMKTLAIAEMRLLIARPMAEQIEPIMYSVLRDKGV